MSFLVCGWKRYMKASARKTLAFFAAATMAIASGPVDAERLLAEDVLARLRRPYPPVDVERVRRRDIDGVDGRVGEERLVGHDAGAGEDIAEAGREGRAARDRLQLSRPRPRQRLREGAGDYAGAEDAPSDRTGRHAKAPISRHTTTAPCQERR